MGGLAKKENLFWWNFCFLSSFQIWTSFLWSVLWVFLWSSVSFLWQISVGFLYRFSDYFRSQFFCPISYSCFSFLTPPTNSHNVLFRGTHVWWLSYNSCRQADCQSHRLDISTQVYVFWGTPEDFLRDSSGPLLRVLWGLCQQFFVSSEVFPQCSSAEGPLEDFLWLSEDSVSLPYYYDKTENWQSR